MISVIIPAHNEAEMIGDCLSALLASATPDGGFEILVIANGCSDDTAAIAKSRALDAANKGIGYTVLDLPDGGKLGALNAGDAAAKGDITLYLDADVLIGAEVLSQIAKALAGPAPRYASGQVQVPTPTTFATRAYRRFYLTVPFMTQGVPGCGLFAVNAAGRSRWGEWPDIISDDTFARLNFTTDERVLVPAAYSWPLVEGFANLVKVRRRQNAGVAEIEAKFPLLLHNDDKRAYGLSALVRNALSDPIAFGTYAAVALAVKFGQSDGWSRGR